MKMDIFKMSKIENLRILSQTVFEKVVCQHNALKCIFFLKNLLR
jgi:hypothetical protein